MKYGKAYPYLKALLDASIEAAPNWAKAPSKFISSLSEQLKTQSSAESRESQKEIKAISQDQLREMIKEAGCQQKENIELIAFSVKSIPQLMQTIESRFDKVDASHENIIEALTDIKESLANDLSEIVQNAQQQTTFKIDNQQAARDIYQAGGDIIFQLYSDKLKELAPPLTPSLNNQTPPESCFVGREEMLATITGWYNDPDVRIGGLVGWGGVGKSALVRKWYDSLDDYTIEPDGIFWWGFYRNAHLELFLNTLLRFLSAGQIEPESIKSTWAKTDTIKQYLHKRPFLIILDGLEQMQKPGPGDLFGRMIHREFTELLHYLAEGHPMPSLCLITTRYELKDLDDWLDQGFQKQQLIDLSTEDAISMLKERGIKGNEEQLEEVVKRYKGHALSLTSVAGFLERYYDYEIKQAPDIEFVLGDKERFLDVNKLLNRYAEKMSPSEKMFLNIFSLFRQEITEDDFAGVFRHKIEGTKFNNVLVKMSDLDFSDLINGLVDWRLISFDQTTKTYTAHPVIKSYFESDFDNRIKKLCHKRIYQYLGKNAPELPESLDQMQPLFEQVHHGCTAGLYDEVFEDVYLEKIQRKGKAFIIHILGAWEINLSLIRTFFPKGYLSKLPLVSKRSNQSWLLNEAGLVLLSTGRKEAEEPLKTSIKLYIDDNQIGYASVGYQNLAGLQFRTGELASGLHSAEKALEFAEKTKSEEYIIYSKVYLGWILYLSGETEKAEKNFRVADELAKKISRHRLYSLWGIHYADFLISMKKIDEVYELTKENLEICQRNNLRNEISRCHRCLGAIESKKNNLQQAKEHLQKALDIARRVGQLSLEIEALIEFGRLNLEKRKYEDAIGNAEGVLKICGRTGFIFYEPDTEIVLSRAYLGLKDIEKAKGFGESAYEKAVSMKYRWAEGDGGHLLGEIYLAEDDVKKARVWLKKAIGCRREILDPDVTESEKLLVQTDL